MKKLRELSREYLLARQKFRKATDQDPLLSGNDNIVGRIGEFIAVQFLKEELGRKKIVKNPNPVQKGYDIVADRKKVSVKTITAENATGRTTSIKEPWDELILVELNDESRVSRIGYVKFVDFKKWSKYRKDWYPVASRTMFNEDGLIGEQGDICEGKKVERYL
ncbi:MAG: hypothetical protein WC654_00235 [Patescibacteria group bacterium]